MTLAVAIASEFDPYDGELYRHLLEQLLGQQVSKWIGEFAFNGDRSVAKYASAFLTAAANNGVRHALLAVDNDGGSSRRQEHIDECAPLEFSIDDRTSCRQCWLERCVPATWAASATKTCIVVPVQTIETWLLAVRGDELHPCPEQKYDRRALKKLFLRGAQLPTSAKVELALQELRKPSALDILRQRPSFQRFESQLMAWKASAPSPSDSSPSG